MARELTVREARATDVAAIQHVACAAWHAAYDDLLGPETVEEVVDDWYAADGLRENVTDPEHVFLVATQDGDVVGFAHACQSRDEADVAVLPRIYVAPDHWNEGIGGSLLARVERLLDERGFKRLRLEVFAENDVGVSFYESTGFDRIDERELELGGQTHVEYVYGKDIHAGTNYAGTDRR